MSTNVAETPVVNTEVLTKAEQTPRQNTQGDATPRDATPKAATPRAETEKKAAVENQTAQSAEEKKVLGLTELTNLNNKIDEILLRSSSATLISQRNLSSSLDVSYLSYPNKTVTVETVKTSANPLYTSQIHATSPTYSLAATNRSDIDLLRSIQNYQVKTVHGVESLTRTLPTQYHHVEEIRSATYPSYSFAQHQVGYDKQKLDQIISRIQGTTPRTHTLEVVKNHSAPLEYRVQASETKKSSRPQKESFKQIEADEDSFIQETKSAQQQRREEQVELESPTKKRSVNKRQEILSAKKQSSNGRETYSPSPKKAAPVEERQKRQAPPVDDEQERKDEEKNELVMLSKKPSLRNSYYFGNEQRRGGSTLLQDGRHRE